MTVSGLGVVVAEDVAHLQVSGHLALASVTEAGGTSALLLRRSRWAT